MKPNQLFEGERVFLRDREGKSRPRAVTGQLHVSTNKHVDKTNKYDLGKVTGEH
jgi:hypothetical protein